MDTTIIKKKLFRSAMQGNWSEIVNIYEANEEAHMVKITKSGDTALHIAVSDYQPAIVEQLVRIIRSRGIDKAKKVLEIQNDRGNTSLHLAASIGSVGMCKCIADTFTDLIGSRNHDYETPLFLAALHGKKDAFLYLDHRAVGWDKQYTYCRRKDGDTILHSAIAGEYFDLAFQIIVRYDHLVHYVNDRGLSPLHLLATKPSAFRSGSDLRWFTNIIYRCIFVEELKVETFKQEEVIVKTFEEEKDPPYPENYQTCINFLRLPLSAITILFDIRNHRSTNLEQAYQNTTNAKTGRDPAGRTDGQADLEKYDECQSIIAARTKHSQEHQLFPSNYRTCFEIIKFVSKALLVILGYGYFLLYYGIGGIRKIEEIKKKHVWTAQIMNELLCRASFYEFQDDGHIPEPPSLKIDAEEIEPYIIIDEDGTSDKEGKMKMEKKETPILIAAKNGITEMAKKETPILIAAKNGITEMVDRILQLFPVAIHDVNSEKKSIVLLAVEHRQPHIYRLLLRKPFLRDTVFRHVDEYGNSALHLVANLGHSGAYPFAAVQMQWEVKWYLFVRNSVPRRFFVHYNEKGQTAKEIFRESHQELASKGGEWLNNISNSCSVVATLVAGVSFATTATAPGGIEKDSCEPSFGRHPGFLTYAVSSLIALVFSVTSLVTFLSILTARRKMEDFERRLPGKLLLGLTCLFISIAAMLVCFCGAHFFLLRDVLEDNAFTVYALACLPVTIFAIAQFPFYFVLLSSTFQQVPQRHFT